MTDVRKYGKQNEKLRTMREFYKLYLTRDQDFLDSFNFLFWLNGTFGRIIKQASAVILIE